MIRRSTRGAATTATTRSRCSRGSGPAGRCTRSRCPTGSAPGSSSATPRPGPRSTTRGCPRTCTPRSPATAPWSPRACPAPRSPGTCSASTRPTTPGCAGWPRPRSADPRVAALRPRVQAIVDDLLDELQRRGDTVVDLVAGFAFPLPFTVISELLGVPEPDRAELGAWFTTLLAPASAPEPPPSAVAASANIVRYLTELLDRKRVEPGEDLVTDLVRAGDERDALNQQEMLSTIFQLTVAGHDTTTSLIGNGTVALLRHPDQRAALARRPRPAAAGDRGDAALGRPRPALDVPLHHPGRPARRRRDPRPRAGDHLAGGGQPRPGPLPGRRSPSTSPAPTTATWPSATASTTASAPGWPGWRA